MKILAVTNLYPTTESPTLGTFVEQQIQGLRKSGAEVKVLFVNREKIGMKAYLGLGQKIRMEVKGFQPDLVHVMYGGILAEVVTRVVRNVPVIVSFCGSDLYGGPYYPFFRRLVVNCGVWASRLAGRRAAGVVVKSKNLEIALPKSIDGQKVIIIPNGIDLSRFQPQDRGECCRSLGWNEGTFHVLTTAFPGHIRKRYELAQAAVDRLREKGLTVELHSLQHVPHEQVPLRLNASDVILLTSSHEGSPNIIKEALACNRSVVSVDVGDVRERIEGVSGCFLASATSEDLASKLQLVYQGPRCANGRGRMQELSLERVAERLTEFYLGIQHPPVVGTS